MKRKIEAAADDGCSDETLRRSRSQAPAESVAIIGQERGRLPAEHSLIKFFNSRRMRLRSASRSSMTASLCSASVRVSPQLCPSSKRKRAFDLFQRKPKLLRPLDENDTLYGGG